MKLHKLSATTSLIISLLSANSFAYSSSCFINPSNGNIYNMAFYDDIDYLYWDYITLDTTVWDICGYDVCEIGGLDSSFYFEYYDVPEDEDFFFHEGVGFTYGWFTGDNDKIAWGLTPPTVNSYCSETI